MDLKNGSYSVKKQNRLGKGLDSLLSVPAGSARVLSVDIDKIFPNPDQPRKNFENKSLDELAQSIKNHGILQPILVSSEGGEKYQIIAGERRWRASQRAGLHKIPVIIKTPNQKEARVWALLENLQRKDLNPIEQAQAYRQILDHNPELTHQNLAKALGQSRSSLANILRLLNLDPEVQAWMMEGKISLGQGKELLRLNNAKAQKQFARSLLEKKTSVRTLSRRIKPSSQKKPAWVEPLRQKLEKKFCVEVRFDLKKEKGKISFVFSSEDELKRLLDKL